MRHLVAIGIPAAAASDYERKLDDDDIDTVELLCGVSADELTSRYGFDSEGVAAVIAEVEHCGFTTNTGTEWKCAVAGCTPGASTGTIGCSEVNTRTYHVLDTAMGWAEARQACRQAFPGGDLASIHNAEQQNLATDVCRAQVEQN